MKTMTVMDMVKETGMEYATCMGLVKVMMISGVATVVGKRKTANGKGKPSIIYEFPTQFTLDFDVVAQKVKEALADDVAKGKPEDVPAEEPEVA